MADEVYQQNVYKDGKEFISLRKVIHEMGEPYSDSVELISMNSTSKGILGECGLRGGYMETHNLSNRAEEMLYKLKSIELCSNTPGQIATHLMVDPPQPARESAECVDLYNKEANFVMGGMTERAKLLTQTPLRLASITSHASQPPSQPIAGRSRVSTAARALRRSLPRPSPPPPWDGKDGSQP